MSTLDKLVLNLKTKGKWEIGDPTFVIDQIGLFPTKVKALKEYVANSLDSAAEADQPKIDVTILLDQEDRNIIISDNGKGIPADSLISLTEKIGESKKRSLRGVRRLIGNKAFGMQAFRTIGERAVVVSRAQGENSYNAIQMRADSDPVYGLNIDPELIPGPKFEYGTRVIIGDVDIKSFKSSLSASALRKELGRIFEPRLKRDNNNTKIWVSYYEKGIEPVLTHVELPSYSNCIPLEEVNINLTDLKKQFIIPTGGHIESLYELYLFVDPTGKSSKLRLHNEDVEVCNLAALYNMQKHPWTSPNLTGYINVTFFELTPTRDSVVDIGKRFDTFKGLVINPISQKVEKKLEEVLSEFTSSDLANKEKKLYDDAQKLMEDTYKNCDFIPPIDNVKEIVVTEVDPQQTNNIVDEDKKERKKKEKNVIPYPINFTQFSEEDGKLPHKYDYELGSIYVNIGHQKYKNEVLESNDKSRAIRYLGDQLSLAIATADVMRWAKRNGEKENIGKFINNITARAADLLSNYRLFANARKR